MSYYLIPHDPTPTYPCINKPLMDDYTNSSNSSTNYATPTTTLSHQSTTSPIPPNGYYWTGRSFTQWDPHGIRNLVGSSICNGPIDTYITTKLPGYPNILRALLYAILFVVQHRQHLQSNVHIFIDSLNSLHLLAYHLLRQPSSQHNHLDKLLCSKQHFPYPTYSPPNLHTKSKST